MTEKHPDRSHARARAGALALGLSLLTATAYPAGADEERPLAAAAPVNAAFTRPAGATLGGPSTAAGQGRVTGHLPSPLDYSHMTGSRASRAAGLSPDATPVYPSYFDLRDSGKVTGVRNQGACGDCWSFATIASLESNQLVGDDLDEDFSENHQNVRHGFDYPACQGGNGDMAGAYMTRWGNADALAAGLVDEADDPYTGTAATSNPGLTPRVHLQEFLVLPDRANATDNDDYKYALQNYGALSVGLYYGDGYFKSATAAYYYDGSASTNHEVALVGWDDDYPASNFKTAPPGNGAFIAKNSWGSGWGKEGYFYISYYDARLQDAHVFRAAEDSDNYARAYLYDPFGQTSALGYNADSGWGANVFTAAADETLQAVAIYTGTLDSSYSIYVYTGVAGGPTTGTLDGGGVNTSGSAPYAGYHTIELARPVTLRAGQKFSVVVRFTTPGYNYPIPMEKRFAGYDSGATASPGQSYVSSNGGSWSDLTGYYSDANVDIRAYTGNADSGATAPAADTRAASVVTAQGATLNGTVDDHGADTSVGFDYGTTTTYGSSAIATPGTLAAGRGQTAVSAALTGLTCGTTYHYRVSATNSAGTTHGDDLSVTTLSCPNQLTVVKIGNGTLTSTPSGIACGDTCSAGFAPNAKVKLAATPAADWKLTGWSGCGKSSGASCTLDVTSSKTVTATFSPKLTVTRSGNGKVTSSPSGIKCGSACSAYFPLDSQVTLTATPARGQTFKGWTGCASSNGTTCTVEMTDIANVGAAF